MDQSEVEGEKKSTKLRSAIERVDVSIVSVEFLVQVKSDPAHANRISEFFLHDTLRIEKMADKETKGRRQSSKRVSYSGMDDEEEQPEQTQVTTSRSKKVKKETVGVIKEEETIEESRIVTVIKKGRSAVDSFCPVASSCHVYEEKDCVYGTLFNIKLPC